MKNFTKIMLCIALTLAGTDTARAQIDAQWTEDGLTWESFKGYVSKTDTFAVNFVPYVMQTLGTVKEGRSKYKYFDLKTCINSEASAVADTARTPERLSYAQLEFDIFTLNMRKALLDYYASTGEYSLGNYVEKYGDRIVNEMKRANDDTDNGRNAAKVAELRARLKPEIRNAEFDPVKYAAQFHDQTGMLYGGIGLTSHIPFSDYVKPMYGIEMDCGFSLKKSPAFILFDLGLDFFGEAKLPIKTKKGLIKKGDNVFGCYMDAGVGYMAVSKPRVMFAPFVSVGVRTYDGGDDYSSDKVRPTETAGLSLSVGGMAFVKLKTNYYVMPSKVEKRSQTIRVKPYLRFTKHNDPMGWVPSLNISLTYERVDQKYAAKKH